MKRTLFLSALTAALVVTSAQAANVFLADGGSASVSVSGDRILIDHDASGDYTYSGNIAVTGGKPWIGPGTTNASGAATNSNAIWVTLSGVLSGAGEFRFNDYAPNGNNTANVIWDLTGESNAITGTITVDHGGEANSYSQVNLNHAFVNNATPGVWMGNKDKEILNIATSSITLGTLEGGNANSGITASTATTLTLNTTSDKTFSGTIGKASYFTHDDYTNASPTHASADISIIKQGNATQTISGAVKLASLTLQAGTMNFNGATAIGDLTYVLDNRAASAMRGESSSNGIAGITVDFSVMGGSGAVSVSGTKTATLGGEAVAATWSTDNKTVTVADTYNAYYVSQGTVGMADVNTAIAASSNVIAIKVADGATLSGLKKPNEKNKTDAVVPPDGVNIFGTGTVQVNGDLQYHNQTFLEQFEGVVDVKSGVVQIGNQGSKFAKIKSIALHNGGALKGWGTTFNKDILMTGGTLGDAGANMTYTGKITAEDQTFSEINATQNQYGTYTVTIEGAVSGSGTITKTGNGIVKYEGAITDASLIGDGAKTQVSTASVTGATLQNLVLDNTKAHTLTNVTLNEGVVANGAITLSDSVIFGTDASGESVALTMGNDVAITLSDGLKVYITTGDVDAITTFGEAMTLVTELTSADKAILGEDIQIFINGDYQEAAFLTTIAGANGTVSLAVVPEPATATLSLLALAGLAARRRRH